MGMAQDTSPLLDARELVTKMPDGDRDAGDAAISYLVERYNRVDDFGQLAKIGRWLAIWQRRTPPRVENPTVAIFAGSHGLAGQNVSVTTTDGVRSRFQRLKEGRAALNAIAAEQGATIRAFELAVDQPTEDITRGPAMTPKTCAATIAYGFEALAESPDLLSIGVMGSGVGTSAAALACALYGGDPAYWVRPGPGTPREIAIKRAEVVSEALARHRGVGDDPLLALATLGGRELAACVGAIIAARHQGVPVIIDGFATAVAAGVVRALRPDGISHCLAANKTMRPAHEAALERIALKPLLDLGLMSGGGMGSTLAIGLVRSAAALHIAKPEG